MTVYYTETENDRGDKRPALHHTGKPSRNKWEKPFTYGPVVVPDDYLTLPLKRVGDALRGHYDAEAKADNKGADT